MGVKIFFYSYQVTLNIMFKSESVYVLMQFLSEVISFSGS